MTHPDWPRIRPDGWVETPPGVARRIVGVLWGEHRKARDAGYSLAPEVSEYIWLLDRAAKRQALGLLSSSAGGPTLDEAGQEAGGSSRELSAAAVAAYLGTTASWVRRLARTGALRGHTVGRDWFFAPADVEAFDQSRDLRSG